VRAKGNEVGAWAFWKEDGQSNEGIRGNQFSSAQPKKEVNKIGGKGKGRMGSIGGEGGGGGGGDKINAKMTKMNKEEEEGGGDLVLCCCANHLLDLKRRRTKRRGEC
jgi:hypothetical protein